MSESSKTQAIIQEALDAGFTVSVFDGEEWAVKKSTDALEIFTNATAVDECKLRFRFDGETFCTVLLIFGNGEDDLVADVEDYEDENGVPVYQSQYW